jgi:uncharacterized membrane protein (UPF0127 family)
MRQTGIVGPGPQGLTCFRVKNANPVSFGLAASAAALMALLAGCGPGAQTGRAAADEKTVLDHFTVLVGGHSASLQFAVLPGEQERGLMQRLDLGADEGMLFVDPAPKRENFWMKNTPEALDIAYAGRDGVIAEIYPMYPFDLSAIPSRSDQMQMALEMRQGWFAANGVRPGAAIDLVAVAAALKARGFDPTKYGIRPEKP